jgi:hypothetical protein
MAAPIAFSGEMTVQSVRIKLRALSRANARAELRKPEVLELMDGGELLRWAIRLETPAGLEGFVRSPAVLARVGAKECRRVERSLKKQDNRIRRLVPSSALYRDWRDHGLGFLPDILFGRDVVDRHAAPLPAKPSARPGESKQVRLRREAEWEQHYEHEKFLKRHRYRSSRVFCVSRGKSALDSDDYTHRVMPAIAVKEEDKWDVPSPEQVRKHLELERDAGSLMLNRHPVEQSRDSSVWRQGHVQASELKQLSSRLDPQSKVGSRSPTGQVCNAATICASFEITQETFLEWAVHGEFPRSHATTIRGEYHDIWWWCDEVVDWWIKHWSTVESVEGSSGTSCYQNQSTRAETLQPGV